MTSALPDIRISDHPPDGWPALVEASPVSTFFHASEWVQLYARRHDGEPRYLFAEADGRIVAGLPYVRFRRGIFHFCESLPLGTYGGPITGDRTFGDSVDRALLDRFTTLERHPLCIRLQCVIRHAETGAASYGFAPAPLHIIPLPDSFDVFWREVFPMNRRNECRRAAKHGATVDTRVTHDDIDAYYPLDVAAHERWGLRPHPARFFHDIADMETPLVRVFVVRAEGRLLGLHVCFVSGDELIVWHGVTSREGSKRFFPTSMLARAEAEYGIELGLAAINMGASGALEGIANYKKLLGGELTETMGYERNHPVFTLVRWIRRRRPRPDRRRDRQAGP